MPKMTDKEWDLAPPEGYIPILDDQKEFAHRVFRELAKLGAKSGEMRIAHNLANKLIREWWIEADNFLMETMDKFERRFGR